MRTCPGLLIAISLLAGCSSATPEAPSLPIEGFRRLGDPEAAVLSHILRELEIAHAQSAIVGMTVYHDNIPDWRIGPPSPTSFLGRFSGQTPSVRAFVPQEWDQCGSKDTSCGRVIFLNWQTIQAGVVQIDVWWDLAGSNAKRHRYSATYADDDVWNVKEVSVPTPTTPPAARISPPPNNGVNLPVRTVTGLANSARPAPARPAGYAERYLVYRGSHTCWRNI
jgi:hypothetical protein